VVSWHIVGYLCHYSVSAAAAAAAAGYTLGVSGKALLDLTLLAMKKSVFLSYNISV
jgi:hypothetical protein